MGWRFFTCILFHRQEMSYQRLGGKLPSAINARIVNKPATAGALDMQ